jgi:gas vesicle protein
LPIEIAHPGGICYHSVVDAQSEPREVLAMENKETASIGWFVAGLTLGTLLGVLFAPQSGKETREEIAESAREGRDYVAERSRRAQERLGSLVERGKDQVEDLTGRAKDTLNRGRSAWNGLANRGRDVLDSFGGQTDRIAAMEAGKEAFLNSLDETGEHRS